MPLTSHKCDRNTLLILITGFPAFKFDLELETSPIVVVYIGLSDIKSF